MLVNSQFTDWENRPQIAADSNKNTSGCIKNHKNEAKLQQNN
jgi:hypothetical protein